jgi:hypothetical protein
VRHGCAALMLATALAANEARADDSAAQAAGPASSGEETPHATPYRPSVSTPAALSVPGWIEVEAGGLRARAADGSRRDSLPVTVKLAFTPDWGVRVSTDGWAHLVDPAGANVSGGGDATIVLKRRFAVNEASAFGLEAGVSLPTARSGLGSGETDYTLNGVYSADLPAQLHVDLNLSPTYLRHVEAGTAHTQWLWAAAVSRALNDRWGLVVEPSGTRRGGTQSTAQLLGALSYNVSAALVLDSGFAFSVKNGGKDRSFFAGLTWLALRLF